MVAMTTNSDDGDLLPSESPEQVWTLQLLSARALPATGEGLREVGFLYRHGLAV